MQSAMLKVATWNVNGIRARARDVAAFIEREQPDILCLQEIKAAPEKVPSELLEHADYHAYWHGHKGYSGVGLQLARRRFPLRPQFEHPEFDHETRIVCVRLGDVLCASIYVPNGGKDFEAKLRFLDGLEALVARETARGTQLLLCGDLNVARQERDVHVSLRKADQIGCTPLEREKFGAILDHGLVDLGRAFAPDADDLFTWWAPWRNLRQRNIGWRIDYILLSGALAAAATSCKVQREFGTSDHGPLVAELDYAPAVPVLPPGAQADSQPVPRGDPQLKLPL